MIRVTYASHIVLVLTVRTSSFPQGSTNLAIAVLFRQALSKN